MESLVGSIGIYVRGNEGYPRYSLSTSPAGGLTEEDVIKLFEDAKKACIKILKEDGVI